MVKNIEDLVDKTNDNRKWKIPEDIDEWMKKLKDEEEMCKQPGELNYVPFEQDLGSALWFGMLPATLPSKMQLIVVEADVRSSERGSLITFTSNEVIESGNTSLFEFSWIVGLPGDLVFNDRKNRFEKLTQNGVFVIGDRRDKSANSRDFGVVDLKTIEHRVVEALEESHYKDSSAGKI